MEGRYLGQSLQFAVEFVNDQHLGQSLHFVAVHSGAPVLYLAGNDGDEHHQRLRCR